MVRIGANGGVARRVSDESQEAADERLVCWPFPQMLRLWLPVASMLLVSLISYVDRNALAVLAPTILRETGLNGEQYGLVISAFSFAYMIGNPVWGWGLDRFGLRVGMALAVTVWTVASASHGFAVGLWSFALARAVLGFGEGATFPGGMRTAILTLPASLQSRGIAVAYSGGSLGAVIAPALVTPVAAWFGWRAVFFLTGLIGMTWVAWWWRLSRGLPAQAAGALAGPEPSRQRLSFARPEVWAFMAVYAMGGFPLAFVLYQAALYLGAARGLTQVEVGSLLWIPPLGWEVGYFFWGWVADRFLQTGRWSYRAVLGAAALLSLPLAWAVRLEGIGPLMAALFFAMFVAAAFVIVSVRYAVGVHSPGSSGLIAGLGAGSWSAVVASLMPRFGRLFDQKRYDDAFLLAAVIPLAGYLVWLAATRAGRVSYTSQGRER